jgi:hypothetical protein
VTPEGFVLNRIEDIGTSAGARVYMLKLPQPPTPLPAVRVQWINDVIEQHLRGPQPPRTWVQVDGYVAEVGDYWAEARALADAIHGDGLGSSASGLFGWKGEFGGSPAIVVENVSLISRGDVRYESDEQRLVGIRQEYRIHWRAA